MTKVQRPVDLHALQAFVLSCEGGSMTRAAQTMGISQSAVSQLVKNLETRLGIELLDRTLRPPQPTAAGRSVLERAHELLLRAHQLTDDLHAGLLGPRSPFKLGCVDSFVATIGPALIKALSGQAQDILMWSGLTPDLQTQLLNRELDVAIGTDIEMADPRISEQPLFSESFLLLLPAQQTASGSADLLRVMRQLPLIRYSLRSAIGSQVEHCLAHLSIRAPRRYEFDATEPLLSLVAAGLGWAVSTPLCLLQARHHLPAVQVHAMPDMRGAQRSFSMRSHAGEWGTAQREIARVTRIVLQQQILPELGRLVPQLPTQSIALPAVLH